MSDKFSVSVFQTTDIYAKDIFDPFYRDDVQGEPDIEIKISCIRKNQDNELLRKRILDLADRILNRIADEHSN